ncbi:MAG TPA: hypothetical protein VKM36_06880 [Balneolaceae bacterium]|nr:hypothetical protein [Balneolaceae bacterium]
MMQRITLSLLLAVIFLNGCDAIFNSKQDDITDEIFEEGRIDPTLERIDGYVAIVPFWEGFDQPTDVFVGFDGFVYVTDATGIHALDRADIAPRRTIELPGAVSVTQDRLLNLYVAARYDTVINDVDPDIEWNLPAVYKIKNLNGAGEIVFQDTLIHPFFDASRSTRASRQFRLDRSRPDNDELVEVTGVAALADNSIYISRRGPRNNLTSIEAPDNTVLEFTQVEENGTLTPKMRNVRQIRALNPTTPSLLSGIGMSDIITFISPPQRDIFTDDRSFIISQTRQDRQIPFKVLQVNVEETPDGLVFQPNFEFLIRDTTRADGFLYEELKFERPTGIAFAGDASRFIFVVDADQNKLFQFQANGEEGVNPPLGAADRDKRLIVSFGEQGSGPRQFNNPSGVAYFDEVVYVADKGNNRIARYKLSSDFEN